MRKIALSGFLVGMLAWESHAMVLVSDVAVLEVRAPVAPQLEAVVSPRVYPSPWRADQHGSRPILFDQLSANSTVKLYSLSGQWIRTMEAPMGHVAWDLKNDRGEEAASGIYFYRIINAAGSSEKGRLAIIR